MTPAKRAKNDVALAKAIGAASYSDRGDAYAVAIGVLLAKLTASYVEVERLQSLIQHAELCVNCGLEAGYCQCCPMCGTEFDSDCSCESDHTSKGEPAICYRCNGSGEGPADGTSCCRCGGNGELSATV